MFKATSYKIDMQKRHTPSPGASPRAPGVLDPGGSRTRPRAWCVALLLLLAAGCQPQAAVAPAEPPWFEDVTDKLGLTFRHDAGVIRADYFMPQSVGSGCAFLDFDGDGWLDLVVVNYVDYDPSLPCSGRGGKRDFCGPNAFQGTVARLYRNLGADKGPRFEDVTLRAGLTAAKGKGLGVLCADFDGDGWP